MVMDVIGGFYYPRLKVLLLLWVGIEDDDDEEVGARILCILLKQWGFDAGC